MSSLQTTDINTELLTFGFIRANFDHKYEQNVPMALQYLILKFSNKIIGCSLLSIQQDLNLFQSISTKLSQIRRFNLLFRASDHEHSGSKFHDYCNNKGATITIIESNYGNIFGGYTSISWKSTGEFGTEFRRDKNAFLFLIKSDDESIQKQCPLLFGITKYQARTAIRCVKDYGPTFGVGADIFIPDRCNQRLCSTYRCSYDSKDVKYIGGGSSKCFEIKDYEVFKIDFK